ncbi:hypothetical protein F2Q68_00012382 [Brassica cretica]|uniref:Uncharacterized protein n=1 Tax=Brassica cretica TaxID=69181 RepID=A0A8S9L336_BRACR|nr:hypothetical protein F2Q68_00012382 [Brassica cretica]
MPKMKHPLETPHRRKFWQRLERDLAAGVDGVYFNLTKEKVSSHLAMAISLSDPDPTENADAAQLDAAKRISFKVKAPVTDTDLNQKVKDGFCDVFWQRLERDLAAGVDGVYFNLTKEKVSSHLAMAISLSDPDPTENADAAQLDAAKRISFKVKAPVTDTDLNQKVKDGVSDFSETADIVAEYMGGPVENADEALRRWMHRSYEFRNNFTAVLNYFKFVYAI